MNLRALLAAGLAALVLGLLLGFIPSSTGSVPCGSPWVRDTAMIDAANRGAELGSALAGRGFNSSTDYRTLCGDALDGRGILGGALAGLGVLTLLGAALVSAQRSTDQARG